MSMWLIVKHITSGAVTVLIGIVMVVSGQIKSLKYLERASAQSFFLPVNESLKGVTLREEFERNPECSKESFHEIKTWLEEQEHLPKISDEKLFQFFFSCFYNIGKTKKCIETFYQIKTNSPDLYTNRDISDLDLQKVFSCASVFTFPILTPVKKYRVTYLRVEDEDVSLFDFVKSTKLFLMAYDAELYLKGTARGHVIIFDLKNIGFKHIMKCGLDTWKKIIKLTQEALPVRRKTLHILNTNYFIYKFAQVLKPFIRPEVFNTIHLHRPDDFDDLYKIVPQECLPAEYGGSLESVETYTQKFKEQLWKLRNFFNEDDKLIIH